MKDKKVICINDDNDNRLILHKEYTALSWKGSYIIIDDYNKIHLGLFSTNLFKTKYDYRKERITNVLY